MFELPFRQHIVAIDIISQSKQFDCEMNDCLTIFCSVFAVTVFWELEAAFIADSVGRLLSY